MTDNPPDIRFVRLTEISPDVLIAHMSDPRVAEHMPLLKGEWDRTDCDAFIAGKEACWTRDGLGHWGILADEDYVGWGGFQKEGDEWDFGLVLRPDRFGLGGAVTRKALAFARANDRIPYVTFLLPPSRKHLRALDRIGARFDTEIDYDGQKFLKFRLDTSYRAHD